MATTPTPSPVEPGRIGAMGRMFGALFSPKETFADIAARPSWLAPVILLSIISLGFTIAFTQRVGWQQFMEQQLANNPRTANMSAEQRAQAIERGASIAKYFGYGGAALGSFAVVAVLAGIFLGAFNLIGGAGTNYRTSLGILSHSMMPLVVANLLAFIVLFLKRPDMFDLENPLGSNVAAFLSGDAPAWLNSLGRSLDIFAFWAMFLIATGFAAASPKKISLGKGLGIVIGVWAVYVLVKMGWAAAFS